MPVPDKIWVDRKFMDFNEPLFGGSGDMEYLMVEELVSSLRGSDDWKGSGFHLEAEDPRCCVSTTR